MAISTDVSVYVSGITTYTIIEETDTQFRVSYPVGVGVDYTRSINKSGDAAEDESRLDSHLLAVNNKVLVGCISTAPPEVSEEDPE